MANNSVLYCVSPLESISLSSIITIIAGILDNCRCQSDILRPRDGSETAEVTPGGHGDGETCDDRDTGGSTRDCHAALVTRDQGHPWHSQAII